MSSTETGGGAFSPLWENLPCGSANTKAKKLDICWTHGVILSTKNGRV